VGWTVEDAQKLRIMELLFRTIDITDDQKKLDWITRYVDADIHDVRVQFTHKAKTLRANE